MLPLLMAGMAAGQAGLGVLNARKNNKESQRRQRLNTELAALDSRYEALGKSKSGMYAQPMEEKSVLGSGLSGALSGAMQGQNIYQGMQNSKAKQALLAKLAGTAQLGSESPLALMNEATK